MGPDHNFSRSGLLEQPLGRAWVALLGDRELGIFDLGWPRYAGVSQGSGGAGSMPAACCKPVVATRLGVGHAAQGTRPSDKALDRQWGTGATGNRGNRSIDGGDVDPPKGATGLSCASAYLATAVLATAVWGGCDFG